MLHRMRSNISDLDSCYQSWTSQTHPPSVHPDIRPNDCYNDECEWATDFPEMTLSHVGGCVDNSVDVHAEV